MLRAAPYVSKGHFRQTGFVEPDNPIPPVQSLAKNIPFLASPNQIHNSPRPVPQRGVSRSSRRWHGMRGRRRRFDEARACGRRSRCGPDASTLAFKSA